MHFGWNIMIFQNVLQNIMNLGKIQTKIINLWDIQSRTFFTPFSELNMFV